jgi:hypothetical protein
MNKRQTLVPITWHYIGEERLYPGDGKCQFCHKQIFDTEHPNDEQNAGWTLLAPDHHGMPGETLIVGEWCSKECFSADILAQVTAGKQPTRTSAPQANNNAVR